MYLTYMPNPCCVTSKLSKAKLNAEVSFHRPLVNTTQQSGAPNNKMPHMLIFAFSFFRSLRIKHQRAHVRHV